MPTSHSCYVHHVLHSFILLLEYSGKDYSVTLTLIAPCLHICEMWHL